MFPKNNQQNTPPNLFCPYTRNHYNSLVRGEVFKFRLWRFWHEIRRPSPDKRQGFRHTIGRVHKGYIRAPSCILAELSETKVPGEPLFIEEEGGHRPYLPLVDDMVSLLHALTQQKVRVFTAEGITTLTAPANIFQRIKAYWDLSAHFSQYAAMRNWRSTSQGSPKTYVHTLRAIGFKVDYMPYDGETADQAVTRFFES